MKRKIQKKNKFMQEYLIPYRIKKYSDMFLKEIINICGNDNANISEEKDNGSDN